MINRYYKTTISIWMLFTVFSFFVFSYFAYYPQSILLVEAYQPGASYERAKQYLNKGNIDGAIKSYQHGVKYFKLLYEESGLERHKLFTGQGLLSIASIYKNVMKPPELESAAKFYQEAIIWHPYWDKPIPYLFLGETLIEAGKYIDAVSPLSSVIHLGTAPNSMEALYLRGLASFQSGDFEQAAIDWRNYLRFSWGPISTQRWDQFLALRTKSVNSSENLFVQGRERFAREEPEESIEFFTQYLANNPNDIPAEYFLSLLNKRGMNSGFGVRTFTSLFPPEPDVGPIRIRERSLDIYAIQNLNASFVVGIEFKGISQSKQTVKFNLNSKDFYEVIGRYGETQIYKVDCSFLSGRNVLRIREKDPVYKDDGNGVFLRSIKIEAKN